MPAVKWSADNAYPKLISGWLGIFFPASPKMKENITMNVETLVVTTGQSDNHLPQQMHIQTDALIGNQCGKDSLSEHVYLGHKIRYINTSTHGVGINRNEVLMRATGDICVLADDDMVFLDGYEKTICTWFQKLPQADILLLNLEGGKARHRNTKVTRITTMNYGKYGAARIAFRREAVHFSGVMFHTMFGGGCRYSCGEDTLFLRDCLRKGLRIYGIPASIAQIDDSSSSWFQGYSDKYFQDKGILYYALDGKWGRLHAWIHCFRHRHRYHEYGWKNAVKQMVKGMGTVK
ncbi:glycosyltransferase family A protein [Brotocaccenecus cirricatena]|jgi:glycosyltransferase involved in cell wall biosynthesis|nr:glycosyltransferase family A protein [Brotocaccenecus cirricatena]